MKFIFLSIVFSVSFLNFTISQNPHPYRIKGDKYFYGEDNTPIDEMKAYKFYIKAASAGDDVAQCRVGEILAMGDHKSYDNLEEEMSDKTYMHGIINAIKWFKKSAEQGNKQAYYELGSIY